jgi:hypothetical protein
LRLSQPLLTRAGGFFRANTLILEKTRPIERRFVCCVDISSKEAELCIHVFPASVVAQGLHYYFNSKFPNSTSYHLSLDFKPQGKSKQDVQTVGEFINAPMYLEKFSGLGLIAVLD